MPRCNSYGQFCINRPKRTSKFVFRIQPARETRHGIWEIAEDWALKRKRPWKELDKEIEKVLDRKNRICIDAGSGSGRNTDIFLKYAQTIIAIDISRKQIEELNNNIFENCAKSSKNKKEKLSDANPKTSFNLDDENSNEMEGLNFSLRVNGIVGDIMHMPIREHSVDFVA